MNNSNLFKQSGSTNPGSTRLSQLMDDSDHSKCTEENKKLLLERTLSKLRGLKKEILEEDWMYPVYDRKYSNVSGGGSKS